MFGRALLSKACSFKNVPQRRSAEQKRGNRALNAFYSSWPLPVNSVAIPPLFLLLMGIEHTTLLVRTANRSR
jgi:hypothetical protein